MPQLVINGFKMINIQIEQGKWIIVSLAAFQLNIQDFTKAVPIHHTG